MPSKALSKITANVLPTRLRWLLGHHRDRPAATGDGVAFRCNLCGAACTVAPGLLARETPSCQNCGSTMRSRAMAHLLTTELFGRSIALPDLPRRTDIVGIGLSDAEVYAKQLAQKLGYTNTFLHTEPRLDIADIAPDTGACYNFIIASDVFEHVAPPVSRAFANARRLLKPGGVLIFSVPFTLESDSLEHFPELCDYRIYSTDDGWRLENRTADGRVQVYRDLVFHGGPGSTLEMRVFSRAALEREFAAAGFARARVADEACRDFGIVWSEPWSVPMVAYA